MMVSSACSWAVSGRTSALAGRAAQDGRVVVDAWTVVVEGWADMMESGVWKEIKAGRVSW